MQTSVSCVLRERENGGVEKNDLSSSISSTSLIAIPGPADAVLPQAGRQGFLGVLMLDTCFPRPPGDLGHPQAFGVPVRQLVVQGAFPGEVVRSAQGLRSVSQQAREPASMPVGAPNLTLLAAVW